MNDRTMASDEHDVPQPLLAALTAAGDVAYDWDLGTDVIRWHGSLETILGACDPGVIASGRTLARRLNPDDLLLRQQRLNAHWTRRTDFDCEYRVRAENGGFAWVHDRGTATFDAA